MHQTTSNDQWPRPLLTRVAILVITGALAGLFVATPITLASKGRADDSGRLASAAPRQIHVAGAGSQRDPACSITTSLVGFRPGLAMIEISVLNPQSESLVAAEEVSLRDGTNEQGYQASIIFGMSENLHLIDPAGTHFPLRIDVRQHSDGAIAASRTVLLRCYTAPETAASVTDF
ncbi:MAG: hypothetical protein ACLGH3_05365 [Actinomycetota bacterium]